MYLKLIFSIRKTNCFRYTWRHLLKEFSKDYYCVAIDQRGYNISSKPKKFTDYAQYYMIWFDTF